MKIGIIVNVFPAISETFILNQITGLLDLGHEVTIHSNNRPSSSLFHPEVDQYHLLEKTIYAKPWIRSKALRIVDAVREFRCHREFSYTHLFRCLNFYRYGLQALTLKILHDSLNFSDREYDIVHAHFGENGLAAARMKEIGVIRSGLVTSFHGYDIDVLPKLYGSKYFNQLFKIGDIFIANSQNTAKKLSVLGCPREKVIVLPVGVDLEQYQTAGHRDITTINVLSVGRLVPVKGHEYAIDAISNLVNKYPNIRYYIVGEGELRNRLSEKIKEYQLEDHVELLGALDKEQLKRIFNETDIFILPSIKTNAEEGQGLALQEAQAFGIPVVASDSGAVSEGLVPNETGFLVPQRDSKAIAQAVEKLILDSGLRKNMGQKGRKYVSEKYDIKKLNRRLVQVYSQLDSR